MPFVSTVDKVIDFIDYQGAHTYRNNRSWITLMAFYPSPSYNVQAMEYIRTPTLNLNRIYSINHLQELHVVFSEPRSCSF